MPGSGEREVTEWGRLYAWEQCERERGRERERGVEGGRERKGRAD
jgi:hypothetical protein